MKIYILLFGLPILCTLAYAEVYTSISDLEQLVETEEFLIKSLRSYIEAQKEKLSLLHRYVEEYVHQHEIAKKDVKNFLSNPINAYLLVKRLVSDWRTVKELSITNSGIEKVTNISSEYKMPSDEDLNGAAVALIRLQETYKLDTSAIANGKINDIKYSTELNAQDCFELGREMYKNKDYYHSMLWMREAEERFNQSKIDVVQKADIFEYLAISSFHQGNIPLALNLTNKWLELAPQEERAIGNKHRYEHQIKINKTIENNTLDLTSFVVKTKPSKDQYKQIYEQLCRGEVTLPEKIKSQLTCYYEKHNDPFLKIAPFKVEEAYKDPKIVIFHDVLSDEEIETVQSIAKPRFARAGVRHINTSETIFTGSRISKHSWLKDDEHAYLGKISRRVGHMTQLDQTSAEDLQVVNYGIGGHYEPHYDFSAKGADEFTSFGMGNRIATVLFYMSDVEQGGATAFTNIKTAVWPKKGTAVLWYNLFPNGEGNLLTRHAACPVLAGSKWVCNKWIHTYHQEFRRPCDLKPTPPEFTA